MAYRNCRRRRGTVQRRNIPPPAFLYTIHPYILASCNVSGQQLIHALHVEYDRLNVKIDFVLNTAVFVSTVVLGIGLLAIQSEGNSVLCNNLGTYKPAVA